MEVMLKVKIEKAISKRQRKMCLDQLASKIFFDSSTKKFKFYKEICTLNNKSGVERIDFVGNSDVEENVIVIILESPHVDEYEGNMPIGPAQGKTGDNINKYLCTILDEAVQREILNVNSKFPKYDLVLMNAIQYQCSLGMDPILFRDYCFMKLWETEQIIESFHERLSLILKKYNNGHVILINGCTLGSHIDLLTKHKGKITKDYLKEIGYNDNTLNNPSLKAFVSQEANKVIEGNRISQYYISHPSAWYSQKNRKLKKEL